MTLQHSDMKAQPDIKLFHEACNEVINASHNYRPHHMIHYAASYANAGKRMTDRDMIRVQCLYILNNLTTWRGEEAQQVKEKLRMFTKRS